MKKFKRKYFCQDDSSDVLEVMPLGDDRKKLRMVCSDDVNISSVHLNGTQISNLIDLLTGWLKEADDRSLWEDE